MSNATQFEMVVTVEAVPEPRHEGDKFLAQTRVDEQTITARGHSRGSALMALAWLLVHDG